jgi:hypothetical protein
MHLPVSVVEVTKFEFRLGQAVQCNRQRNEAFVLASTYLLECFDVLSKSPCISIELVHDWKTDELVEGEKSVFCRCKFLASLLEQTLHVLVQVEAEKQAV